jgi:two-component system chemotaxis sensor kinase CheA
MARAKFTLDEAAAQLVQLEADEATSAGRLRDRIRRLARSRALSDGTRVAMGAAADALGAVARGGAGAGAALAAAGRHVEAAVRAADDAEHGAEHGAEHEWAPAAPSPVMDPIMLAALAEFDRAAAADDDEVTRTMEREPSPDGSIVLTAAPALPAWSADVTPELLEGFIVESNEYLRDAESALLQLEADPSNVEAVNTVFRCFHTIKGTSAFLGLECVTDVAHGAESLMSRVRDGEIRVEGGNADLALRAVDMLGALVLAVGDALVGRQTAQPAGCRALVAALADPGAALARSADDSPRASRLDGPPPSAEPAGAGAVEAGESWMRVRTDRLDRLVGTIGELVVAQSLIAQDGALALAHDDALTRKVRQAGKIVRELQELSIAMRLVPLKGVMQKLARVARDAAVKSGKQIELIVEGEETEIDRGTVERIGDPLVHMIRNAVDHGIEAPAERAAAGKAPAGTIRIAACHAGGSVVITLSDDGRGLNRSRILEKAIGAGRIDAGCDLSDREVFELIYAPGLSTADEVTGLSGRGVGMDVVRRSVAALRGRIDIESEAGKGSTFAIRLPLTLAITEGMVVLVGAERYIVPTLNIELCFRPERAMLHTVAGRGEMVLLRGDVLPVVRLDRILGVAGAEPDPTRALLMVAGSGERRCALLVDALIGQQQLVERPLGAGLGRVRGISGGAILGDGRVGLILDIAEILALVRQERADGQAA